MKTNQTMALPAMPEQLKKELERLNDFAFKFTYLQEELSAYLDTLDQEYHANVVEDEDVKLISEVYNIRCSIYAIASELHQEFTENLHSQQLQSDNS